MCDLLNPRVFLGHPSDTKIITSLSPKVVATPSLFSLGDVIRRPAAARLFKGCIGDNFGVKGPVMLDSGGFTLSQMETKGWDWKTVTKFYRESVADFFVSLDFPPSRGDDKATRVGKIRKSAQSFRHMRASVESSLIPVIHGREIDEIVLSCKLTGQAGFSAGKIGIGGLVPLLQRTSRVSETRSFIVRAVRTVRQHFTDSEVHVFGAGSPQTIQAMFEAGASTVDSIAWRRAAAFGAIYVAGGSQRLLPGSTVQNRSRPTLNEPELEHLARCGCPACAGLEIVNRLEKLSKSFQARALHNAWTISDTFSVQPLSRSMQRVTLSNGWNEALSA